jgi:hypothetical protein
MAQTTRVPIILTDLPLELLLEIVELSDNDVDRACLILSINYLKAYFDERPIHKLTRYISSKWQESRLNLDDLCPAHHGWLKKEVDNHEVRFSILNKLSHDTSQYIPCWICLERHHWQDIKPPEPNYTHPFRR